MEIIGSLEHPTDEEIREAKRRFDAAAAPEEELRRIREGGADEEKKFLKFAEGRQVKLTPEQQITLYGQVLILQKKTGKIDIYQAARRAAQVRRVMNRKPGEGAPIKRPGLREAVEYLWQAYCLRYPAAQLGQARLPNESWRPYPALTFVTNGVAAILPAEKTPLRDVLEREVDTQLRALGK